MAININSVKLWFEEISNKFQAGTPGTTEFNQLADRAQWEVFMEELGSKSEYQPGRPVPRVHWQGTKLITENLRPFLTDELTVQLSNKGKWTIPDNYLYLDYMGYLAPEVVECKTEVNPTIVTIITGDQLYKTLGGYRAPTASYPHATEFSDYWQIYPNVGYIQLRYLKKPTAPVWVGIVPAGGFIPVYDPLTSIDLEWNPDMMNRIVMQMVTFYAMNIKDNEMLQYAQIPVK